MKSGLTFVCGIAVCFLGVSSLTHTTSSQSTSTLIPVGFVMAFPGDRNKVPNDGKWLLCEGQSKAIREYRELFETVGWTYGLGDDPVGRTTFRLPDYRGYFLRGVSGENDEGKDDKRDPDVDKRRASDGTNAPGGKRIGTIQDDATSLPRGPVPFTATDDGLHKHKTMTISQYPGAYELPSTVGEPDDKGAAGTSEAGKHTHRIIGGDNETRGKNIYVYWIIRAKP